MLALDFFFFLPFMEPGAQEDTLQHSHNIVTGPKIEDKGTV